MGAIKKLMNPFRDRFFADRALRELMIMASANHPNIISYYTGYFGSTTPSGEHDVYICMELMYTTLSQASRRHMNHLHFSSIVYQIHCGLIHLHDHHIYHRDLKPAKIQSISGERLSTLVGVPSEKFMSNLVPEMREA